ncbi:MAG: peptidyl-prolyl cis-trans isomerase [Desulfovibrionaceae bacterium]|nr:peptidyl-prolyl cis-trans isomerase [Desulfovibrionaceae bacterium]
MTFFPRYLRFLILFSAVALLWACDRNAEPPGVVATVNGRPLTLGQLEFDHDLRGVGLVAMENPTVEGLRRDYGRIMAELIIRELMLEELARIGSPVTDETVARLEKVIRADYPPEVFDRMLFEESIDPHKWRESLRTRAVMDAFADLVLKDRARVEVQEAADYYKEHVAEFRRPAQTTFLLVRGPDKKLVEEALRQRDSGRAFPREPSLDEASIQEAHLPKEAIPESWRALLAKLQPGQASPVIQERHEAMALVLVGETPTHTLDPAAAYPLVEQALAEKKRNAAFDAWLAGAVAAADIRISAHLVDDGRATVSEVPSPDILKKEFPGVGAPAGEHAALLAETGEVSKSLGDRFASQPDAKDPESEAGPQATAGDAPGIPTATPDVTPGETLAEGVGRPEILRLVPSLESADEPEAVPRTTSADQEISQPEPTRPQAESVAETPLSGTEAAASPVRTEEAAGSVSLPDQAGPSPSAPDGGVSASVPTAQTGPGEVEFLANKASWITFRIDDGQEERLYLKGGKKHVVSFARKLSVRFGSPSDVSYRFKDRQERVESSAREVKTVDFP